MNEQRYKRPESVLVIISTPAGEVLMLERRRPPGCWQPVTGSLKADESPAQAARREVLEETGIVLEDALVDRHLSHRFPIHPAWRERYAPDVTHNTEHVFTAELQTRVHLRLNPAEHVACAWLPRDEAMGRACFEENRRLIERFVRAASGEK